MSVINIGGGLVNTVPIGTDFLVLTNNSNLTYKASLDSVNTVAGFPAGTRWLFQQTSAPTGWTKDTAFNGHSLRLVSGSVTSGGNVTMPFGNVTFTGTAGATVLTANQSGLRDHTHGQTCGGCWRSVGGCDGNRSARGASGSQATGTAGPFNASAAHSHTISFGTLDFNVSYVDLIIAVKN